MSTVRYFQSSLIHFEHTHKETKIKCTVTLCFPLHWTENMQDQALWKSPDLIQVKLQDWNVQWRLSWCGSGIRGWLTVAAAHKVVLAVLSPLGGILTNSFSKRMCCSAHKKSAVLCFSVPLILWRFWVFLSALNSVKNCPSLVTGNLLYFCDEYNVLFVWPSKW